MTEIKHVGSLRAVKKARSRMLAASFVVVVPLGAGCKKTSIGIGRGSDEGSTEVHRRGDGTCWMSYRVSCPRGVMCNPPAPEQIDCPPSLRDAGEPAPSARRPSGKEDWLRVRPLLWVSAQCTYQPEQFCPPPGKPGECTGRLPVNVACKMQTNADGGPSGTYDVASFVYTDGFGECRRVPPMPCKAGYRCEPPDGEVVACP